MSFDSGDRIEILWAGGVTTGIYADHRNGGRVIIDHPDEGPVLMNKSEFGRCKIRGGMGEEWGTDLDLFWDVCYGHGDVDDTAKPHAGSWHPVVAAGQNEGRET